MASHSTDADSGNWAISSHDRSQTGEKIVVVDDEPGVCALVSDILADAGYRPTVTSDPREALQLIRRERPALVLVDIGMPYVDGHALARAIHEDPETQGATVVFITGLISFSERMKAFRTGARDYVTKPFTPERLLATVARALRPQGSEAPSIG